MIIKFIIGAIIGGLLGFLYYKKFKCPTGGCPITSNPYITTLYGGVMGLIISSYF